MRGRARIRLSRRLHADAPPRHLLAQRHAVAVADVRLALQVLRVRDAPAAPARRPTRSSALLDGAARRGVKELLVLTGDDPAHHPGVRARLARARASTTSSPTSCGAASGRSSAGCCRTRTSARSSREDLARLREVTASQGLMLESTARRPRRPPGARRRRTRRCGWRRSAPPASCGSRSRAGSSSGSARREDDRVAALEALAAVHAEHGHLQEVILQNFVPHRRYYGEEPAEIADRRPPSATGAPGLGDARRDVAAAGVGRAPVDDRRHEAARSREARRLMPGRRHPGPAEPRRLVAGARRGRARPTSAGCSANGDHISPEHPFPSPAPGAQAARSATASR